jgi:hypothetical protein
LLEYNQEEVEFISEQFRENNGDEYKEDWYYHIHNDQDILIPKAFFSQLFHVKMDTLIRSKDPEEQKK